MEKWLKDLEAPVENFFIDHGRTLSSLVKWLLVIFLIVATATAVVVSAVELSTNSCRNVTSVAGFPYRMVSGICMIEVEPGKWIPFNAYRYEVKK